MRNSINVATDAHCSPSSSRVSHDLQCLPSPPLRRTGQCSPPDYGRPIFSTTMKSRTTSSGVGHLSRLARTSAS